MSKTRNEAELASKFLHPLNETLEYDLAYNFKFHKGILIPYKETVHFTIENNTQIMERITDNERCCKCVGAVSQAVGA